MGSGGGGGGSGMNFLSDAMSGGPLGIMGGMQSRAGADAAANAASGAAIAQQQQARQNYNVTLGRVNTATSQMDKTTISGLMGMDQMLQKEDQNMSKQEQLISQIDPTILAASQQALKLLQGQSSSVLAPMQAQRDMQRQKLVSSLREQMGPGAETSSAGLQALSNFDRDTNSLSSTAQQNALNSMGGIASQFNSVKPDMLREIIASGQFQNQKYNIGQDQAQFGLQGANVLNGAMAPMYQSAGGQYAGDMMRGQFQQAMGNQTYGAGVQETSQAKQTGMSFLSMLSDRKLKKNIQKLKVSIFAEVPTYLFEYINPEFGTGVKIGTMAQDLLAVNPKHPAVSSGKHGLMVDYSRLQLA